MHRFVVFAVAVGCVTFPSSAGAGETAAGLSVVTLRPSAGDPDVFAARAADRLGFPVRHVYRYALRGFAAELSPAARAALAADPAVSGVAADKRITATGQVVPTGIRRIHAEPTTSTSTSDSSVQPATNVNVAVLDSGIDPRHPDLNVAGGTNCVGGARFDDKYGHGTHIGGIIGALNNSIGVVGVAPGVRLWGVKVLDDSGDGTVSDLLCGVDWVTASRLDRDRRRNDIAVANLSVGGVGSDDGHCGDTDGDVLHQAICRSVAAGVTYVAAAGNDHVDASTLIPAAYPEVITVSALADSDGRAGGRGGPPSCRPSERDDTLASFSNYGRSVALIAPGVCILSTLPVRGRASEPDAYGVLSGTSFAAPHVAGAAALWLSRHPGATPPEVRRALVTTGSSDWDNRDDPDGVKEPLVDVARLMSG
jgi:subtilisin